MTHNDPSQQWDTSSDPPQGTTYRSIHGHARLTFDREWGRSKPWCSFVGGTAGLQFPTLDAGIRYLSERGHRFAKNPQPAPSTQDDEDNRP